jgi:RNA polymerase sigma factor (sigma-70 family)
MSQRKVIADFLTDNREEMVRFAGRISGDVAGAEDLVQEAWLRCDSAMQGDNVAKPAHLFWRVLRNLSIDRHRRIAVEARVLADDADGAAVAHDQPAIDEMLIAREELIRVQRAMEGLDDRMRAAFEMHRFEGAKLREIAVRLGISVTTAHGLVAAALTVIRDAIPSARD